MRTTRPLRCVIAAAAIATLAACGGANDASQADCLPQADWQALVASGAIKPRPPLRPTDVWSDPWLLRPANGAWGGIPASPVLVLGPYYDPAQLPGYVCETQP